MPEIYSPSQSPEDKTIKMVLQSTLGDKRTYSNLGFGLLGHLLTLITGKSYEQLLFETICDPLEMRNTFLTFNDERKPLMIQGRDEKGQPLKSDDIQMSAFLGAGGTDAAYFAKEGVESTSLIGISTNMIRDDYGKHSITSSSRPHHRAVS